MPLTDSVTNERALHAQGAEAHMIRTRNRIAEFKERVKTITTDTERRTILDAVTTLEAQLVRPVTSRVLKATPAPVQTTTSPTDVFTKMVAGLQKELMALKTQLTSKETHGDVPQPETPATT